MKKFIFLFAMLFAFSLTAAAQFEFTSKAGKKFSVNSAPQDSENSAGGFVMEIYYTVEGLDLVAYYVGKTNGVMSNSIAVVNVKIDKIDSDYFKVKKLGNGCYLQTGTPYTKITHGSDFNADDNYSSDNLQIDFKSCDVATAFRAKVLGDAADEPDLGDMDLSLEDKPKEKPKNTMPEHLFALIGEGSSKFFQFNRKTMEVWDYTSDSVFKVGKINDLGSDKLQMLSKDDSYATYNVKDGKLFNGTKSLGWELDGDGFIAKLPSGDAYRTYSIDRDAGYVYFVTLENKKLKQYAIMGEASDSEILLIFALLEGI